VGALLVLSMVLVVSTAFPAVDVNRLVVVLGAVVAAALLAGGAWIWNGRRGVPRQPDVSRAERENWRMPALALLERPRWSPARRVAMVAMAGYLLLAVGLLAVKAVQIGRG
jgi:hypothetical protein